MGKYSVIPYPREFWNSIRLLFQGHSILEVGNTQLLALDFMPKIVPNSFTLRTTPWWYFPFYTIILGHMWRDFGNISFETDQFPHLLPGCVIWEEPMDIIYNNHK